jgi:hypothetical protein
MIIQILFGVCKYKNILICLKHNAMYNQLLICISLLNVAVTLPIWSWLVSCPLLVWVCWCCWTDWISVVCGCWFPTHAHCQREFIAESQCYVKDKNFSLRIFLFFRQLVIFVCIYVRMYVCIYILSQLEVDLFGGNFLFHNSVYFPVLMDMVYYVSYPECPLSF